MKVINSKKLQINKKAKAVLSFILALLLPLAMIPLGAFAAEGDVIWEPSVVDSDAVINEFQGYDLSTNVISTRPDYFPSYDWSYNKSLSYNQDLGLNSAENLGNIDVHWVSKKKINIQPNKAYSLSFSTTESMGMDYTRFRDSNIIVNLKSSITANDDAIVAEIGQTGPFIKSNGETRTTLNSTFSFIAPESATGEYYIELNLTGTLACKVAEVDINKIVLKEIDYFKPSVDTQPTSCSICQTPKQVSFSTTGLGGVLEYNWYKQSGTNEPVLIGTESTVTFDYTEEMENENTEFYCVVKNGLGSVTTNRVSVNVAGHNFDNGLCTVCNICQTPTIITPQNRENYGFTDSKYDGYYAITNSGNLNVFREYVNAGETTANAVMTNNISLNNVCGYNKKGEFVGSWTPIGTTSNPYEGTFDGQNHYIRLLYISTSSEDGSGLFGVATGGATFKNLTLKSGTIIGTYELGALLGATVGDGNGTITIDRCGNEINISSKGYTGGLLGMNNGNFLLNINNCYNNSNITTYYVAKVGGLVGYTQTGNFTNCIALGSVTSGYPIVSFNINQTITAKNCYSCETDNPKSDYSTIIPTYKFSLGELTYLLNNGVTDGTQVWYQTIDKSVPNFSDNTVYKVKSGGFCDNATYTYSNENKDSDTVTHYYANGICSKCGKYEAAAFHDNNTADTNDDYYEIANKGNLQWFAEYVNNGHTKVNAQLSADIDMNGTTWNTITSYDGVFDGNGYTIRKTNNKFVATLEKNGAIKNLTINGEDFFSTSGDCGGVVGTNFGMIEKCIVKNQFIQNSTWNGFGGIAGSNMPNAKIINCAVIGGTLMLRYSVSNPDGNSVAGISGVNNGEIANCYIYNVSLRNGASRCAITFKENTSYASGTVSNCYYQSNSIYPVDNNKMGGTEKKQEQFASGEVAWLLNTMGKNIGDTDYKHSGIWSKGTEYPIFADDKNKTTYKVGITGASETEYYYNYGETFTLPDNINCPEYTAPFTVKSDVEIESDAAITGSTPTVTDDITFDYSVTVAKDYVPTLNINFDGKDMVLEGEPSGDGDYRTYTFALNGILPQQMTENISADLIINGEVYASKSEYSVREYAKNMLAKSDSEELDTFLVNMLCYGAAAQQHIGESENLATDGISTDLITKYRTSDDDWTALKLQSVKAVSDTNDIDLITWKSAAVIFDETVALRLRFTTTADIDILNGYTFDTSFGDSISLSDAVLESTNGDTKTYQIFIECIEPTDYDTSIDLILKNDKGEEVSETLTYSVTSYIANKKDSEYMKDLVRALYDYGISAKAYQNKTQR